MSVPRETIGSHQRLIPSVSRSTPTFEYCRRVAFSSILESVRGTPFPMPRAFFRTGVTPRVALSALPPAPPALVTAAAAAAAMVSPDGSMVVTDGNGSSNGSAWSGGQPPPPLQQRNQMSDDFSSPQHAAATAASPSAGTGGETGNGGGGGVGVGGGGGFSVGEKRQRRDGGVGAGYYGPSSRLRADAAEAERSRRPRLPLISAPADAAATPANTKQLTRRSGSGGVSARDPSSASFSASEVWWAQTAREEVMCAVSGWQGQGGGGSGGWRAHTLAQMGGQGLWLLQGTVCRGRGAGGALPAVSEVSCLHFRLVAAGVRGGDEICHEHRVLYGDASSCQDSTRSG